MGTIEIIFITLLALVLVVLLLVYVKFSAIEKEIKSSRVETVQYLHSSFSHFSLENEQKLENIRNTMSQRMNELTEDNRRQMEQIRATVDEKLQKTLDERIGQSFHACRKQGFLRRDRASCSC